LRFVARTAAPHFLVVDAERATASGGHDLAVLTYTGETCATAAPLSFATTGEWFTTSGKVNDYSPNSGGCTRYTANGPDRAYSVRLRAGDQLQVTAAPSTSYDVSLYLVSSCSDVNGSCVAGVDSGTAGRVENLYALAQAAGSYNLVIDGFSGSNGTGTLTATVARGESCRDAYKVPPTGGTFRGTTTGYRNDYGISSSTGSCTGWAQVGPDAVYRIELDNTKRLTANLQASWDAALYLISDCAAAATSCLAGSDRGEPESITYTNSSGARRTYYLLVDSFLGSRSGNYTLEITIN